MMTVGVQWIWTWAEMRSLAHLTPVICGLQGCKNPWANTWPHLISNLYYFYFLSQIGKCDYIIDVKAWALKDCFPALPQFLSWAEAPQASQIGKREAHRQEGGAQQMLKNSDPCYLSAPALEKSKQLLVRTKLAAGLPLLHCWLLFERAQYLHIVIVFMWHNYGL